MTLSVFLLRQGMFIFIFKNYWVLIPLYRGGGADGSIATFNETELTFPANLGIDDILDEIGPFILKHTNTMTPGDL